MTTSVRRGVRAVLIALITGWMTLGCMGAINGLTGLDMHMEFGENAIHPTTFAVSELPDEKVTSMGMTATGDQIELPEEMHFELDANDEVRMELITYKVAAGDVETRKTAAIEELEAAGFVKRDEDEEVVVYTKGLSAFGLVVDESSGADSSITMVQIDPVLRPGDEPPAATE